MNRLMLKPDSFWISFTRHFGPPNENAEFNLVSV